MWGVLILICSLENNDDCGQVAKGVLFETERQCEMDIVEYGVPYVLETYPEYLPVDSQCVYWSLLEPKA